MIFDINNKDSLHELFVLLTFNSHSKLRSLLSNFLEILTVLKGIKSGYIGPKQDFDLGNLNNIKDLLTENGNKIKRFVYYPNVNMITDGKLNVDPDTLTTNMYNPEGSVIMGKLLGYPCPGINHNSPSTSVSFNLNVSQTFRKLFNYTDKYTIQITGYRCEKINDSLEFDLHLYKEQLNYYFDTILNFGQVYLHLL